MQMNEVKKAMRLNLTVCYNGADYIIQACRMWLNDDGVFNYSLELLDQKTKNSLMIVAVEKINLKG